MCDPSPEGTITGMLLLPCDPLSPRRPDEHSAPEVVAAREAGIPVALVDHDALTRNLAQEAVRRVPAASDAVYRGWMLRSEQYGDFAAVLAQRDVRLRTSAEQYRRAHELPGWLDALQAVTPRTAWTVGPDLDRFDEACRQLGPGPAVLRDDVKSLKHSWEQAVYVPDAADSRGAHAVAGQFLALRAEDFTGGFVVRSFESFTSMEVRTWWTHGRCSLVTAHPDTPDADLPAPDLSVIEPLVRALGLPFVTVDVVRRDDGVWRVVELGDGQVSDRPVTTAAAPLLAVLFPGEQ